MLTFITWANYIRVIVQPFHAIVCHHIWIKPQLILTWMLKGFKVCTPKCAALADWLFWIKVTWEMADTRRPLWPSFLFPNAGDEISIWKIPSLDEKESDLHIISWDL